MCPGTFQAKGSLSRDNKKLALQVVRASSDSYLFDYFSNRLKASIQFLTLAYCINKSCLPLDALKKVESIQNQQLLKTTKKSY